jgi:adenylylsulfate kinase
MSDKKLIYPLTHKLSRKEKENRLNQKSIAIWLIGLSSSGKSTIGMALEEFLFKNQFFAKLIDGDDLRHRLNSDLGFGKEQRMENLRRAAEVAKLFIDTGVISICSFITPTNELQQIVRNIIGDDDYFEVFLDCSLAECKKRDTKGLYKKAETGILSDFTGVNSPFEPPLNPDLKINTQEQTVEENIQKIYNCILERIRA